MLGGGGLAWAWASWAWASWAWASELPKKIIDKATAQMSLRVKDLDRANGKYTRWDHGGNAASR